MKKILFSIIVLFIIAPAIWAQGGSNSWGTFVPYDSTQTVEVTSNNLDNLDVRGLGLDEPGRFLSIDPLASQYPGFSPYVYVFNNPARYFDPTGMWVAEYDEEGNVVMVQYEEGDTFESLYTQLGMDADAFSVFAQEQGIDISEGPTGLIFDITEIVFEFGSATEFSSDATNMNCFSACLAATGVTGGSEIMVQGGFQFTQEAQSVFGFSTTNNLQTGDMQTWVDASGVTNHAAIKVITNQSGNTQFISRPGPGQNVQLQNSTQLNRVYPGFRTQGLTRR